MEISNPPKLEPEAQLTGTEEPEDTEEPEEPDETEEVSEWLFSVHSIEDALRVSKPTHLHQNYRLALVLARAGKALETLRGSSFSPNLQPV